MAPRVAVIGGGVAGSAFVYGLREQISAKSVSISLFEMGRAAGGRTAVRTTRERPELRINHGAPAFAAHSKTFSELCEGLVAKEVLHRQTEPFGILHTDGSFNQEECTPTRYVPINGSGQFCEALLRGGDLSASSLATASFGTMVNKFERIGDSWSLFAKGGAPLGEFDWIVITSTAIAHPRWTSTFGGDPPLVAAASTLDDRALSASLGALAPLRSKPVMACLLAYEGDAAAAWASLPFAKAVLEPESGEKASVLSRIVVQRLSSQLTAVVLHSTHAFAEGSAHVYGAKSTAARLAGAASDAEVERRVLEQMMSDAEARLAPPCGGRRWLDAEHVRQGLFPSGRSSCP